MSTKIDIQPVARKPGHFEIGLDPRVTEPAETRVGFLILLDGDLVMSPEHLGVGYMAGVLRSVGFTTEIREIPHGSEREAVDAVVAFAPSMVCFTLMSLNVESCRTVAAELRPRLPGVPIVCGGPAGTFAGLDVLRHNPNVDAVAVGEGEPTILDMAQRVALGEPLDGCRGICWRDAAGGLHQNPARPVIHDLEVLPWPARDQLEQHDQKLEYVRVSTSRGCVAQCTFCSAPHLKNRVQQGKPWRARSPEHVLDEVEHIVRTYNFRTIDFVDSTFEDPDGGRVGKKRVAAIAQGIIDRGLDIHYNVCMRAENWKDTPEDNALMDLLVRSGLEKVNVGIEAGTPEELDLWDKRATVEDNATVIRMLREHGIYLAMGFIPFHPYATVDTLTRNAGFLRENAGHNLRRMTERLEIYPGTRIVEKMEADGLLDPDYHRTLDPYGYHFRDERVERLAKHYAALYNNETYHEHGVITEQSSVFEFETFNVVLQTYISRVYRYFHAVPGAADVLGAFRDRVHEIRQEMGRFNYEFFMSNMDAVLTDRLDENELRRQVDEVEQYFRGRIRLIKTEQLRTSKALHRLGVSVARISSSLEDYARTGLPRTYTGEGAGPTW